MDPTGEHAEASDIKFPVQRTWRIECTVKNANEEITECGAQYSMLESECAKYGDDADNMIKDAALVLLQQLLDHNHWTILQWAWIKSAFI